MTENLASLMERITPLIGKQQAVIALEVAMTLRRVTEIQPPEGVTCKDFHAAVSVAVEAIAMADRRYAEHIERPKATRAKITAAAFMLDDFARETYQHAFDDDAAKVEADRHSNPFSDAEHARRLARDKGRRR